MRAIILVEELDLLESYRKALVEAGIYVFNASEEKDLKEMVKEYEATSVLLDIDFGEYQNITYLKEFIKENKDVYILVVTKDRSYNRFEELNEAKVYGVISKHDPVERQIQKIKQLIMRLSKKMQKNRRQNIRVKPSEGEHNICAIRGFGMDISYYSRIENISISGISFIFTGEQPKDSIIYSGKGVELRMELGNESFEALGHILKRSGERGVCVFKEFKGNSKNALFEYLLNQL